MRYLPETPVRPPRDSERRSAKRRVDHLAARMGRWSAAHWKTAVIGWLLFVIGAAFIGSQVGTKEIDENNANVGESKRADTILYEAGFSLDGNGESVVEQSEFILIQSNGLSPSDPAYRAAIEDTVTVLTDFPQVHDLRSPLDPDGSDLVSEDGRSVMISFVPEGTYDEASEYIDDIEKTVEQVAVAHSGLS